MTAICIIETVVVIIVRYLFCISETENIGKTHNNVTHRMLEMLDKSLKEFCKQQEENSSGKYPAMHLHIFQHSCNCNVSVVFVTYTIHIIMRNYKCLSVLIIHDLKNW